MNRIVNTSAPTVASHNETLPVRLLLVVVLAVAALAPISLFIGGSASSVISPMVAPASENAPPPTTEKVRQAYGQLSLSFEANCGQADGSVNYVARGVGYTLALSPTAAVFALTRRSEEQSQSVKTSPSRRDESVAATRARRGTGASDAPRSQPSSAVLRMNLVGANKGAAVEGLNELEGKVNYFIGNDPAQWRENVPTFGRVRYAEVYPGIDVVYYGNQKRLEYDFVVAPGRDSRAIALEFARADGLEVESETGDLLVRVGEDTIRQHAPVTYQETDAGRREVESRYAMKEGGRVGFEVGNYDVTAELIIDPVLQYSTYLGGDNTDTAYNIAVDASGNAIVTGYTASTNFPTAGPFQSASGGTVDAFVTKLNAAGTALIYSTYLGGSSEDIGEGIAVDSAGNAFVTGRTSSTNFPVANALQGTRGGNGNNADAFVTKLNAAGSALVYSTYLGGSGNELGYGIAVDATGIAYLSGQTFSTDFPTLSPFQVANQGNGDAYIAKLNAAGSAFVYSTYLGRTASEGSYGIATDSAGNAYVTGFTSSTDFPHNNSFQPIYGGGNFDAFVTKFNATGSARLYSTFLGGGGDDVGFGIAVDSTGSAYVTGRTHSANFPTLNAFQNTLGGASDAFVAKINVAGTQRDYCTFLGGTAADEGSGIAVDSSGNAYVVGSTNSTNFPTANAFQSTLRSAFGSDVFVTKFNATGSALVYSTYLGGGTQDMGLAIAVDSAGNAYVTGFTQSRCFPTTVGAFDTTVGADFVDAFVSKINETAPSSTLTSCATPTPTPAAVQFSAATFNVTEGCVPATLTLTLTGTPSGTVAVDYTVNEGTAKQKTDFTYVAGTLLPQSSTTSDKQGAFVSSDFISNNSISGSIIFAEGETVKEITILISEDGFAEGTENLTATLSNPRGAGLGSPATTTLNINDNETVNSTTNPIDDAPTYVCQLYHDFLHRQPDPAGHTFWAAEITQCGANQACISERRHNVAAAFFLSIEFQQTGYFVYRAYEAGFDRRPQYEEFMRALNAIGLGVEVLIGDWEQRLATQRRAFAELMVQTNAFKALFPDGMTAEQFADKLFANAGATPTAAERAAVVSAYGVGNTSGRAAALMLAVDSSSVYNKLYNPGFVLIEYFGFMRRDPEDAPDTNLDGFNFWLQKMDDHTLPGEDARLEAHAFARIKRAEMVRAFLIADEYRHRFGP